jgi:hypothetical protein
LRRNWKLSCCQLQLPSGPFAINCNHQFPSIWDYFLVWLKQFEVEIVGCIDKGASTTAPLIIDIYDNRYPANKWCQSIITLTLLLKASVKISIESICFTLGAYLWDALVIYHPQVIRSYVLHLCNWTYVVKVMTNQYVLNSKCCLLWTLIYILRTTGMVTT